MKEIRIHGRGGQGNVAAAEVLAIAAFEDGKMVQAFPVFGSERMGAPVAAFVKMDDRPIRSRSQVYRPDYVIVQDATIIGRVDVTAGLRPGGLVLINTEKDAQDFAFEDDVRVLTVPASRIAQETIGRPIPNTALMGAFAAASGEVTLEAILRAVGERFSGALAERNRQAAQRAYDYVAARLPKQEVSA